MAAATTASTIAAGAFIGSATVYGMAVATAASTSRSVKEFNSKGNWGTVAVTAGGAVLVGEVRMYLQRVLQLRPKQINQYHEVQQVEHNRLI